MSTIRGITVQIGADTTALTAALRDVNDASYKIGKELKDVERLLKFNPHDTELLAQKQKLLGDQVENTKKKLETLRDTQEQVNQQFKNGEISEEQHRAFQREIVKTESQLKNYEKQLKAVNLQNHEFNQKMQETGEKLQKAGERMADVGKTLSTHLTVPLTALGALAAKSAIDFESAFAGVRKTVDATEEEFAALERGIRDMAKEIPAAAIEIAGVGEAAGQLGIKTENILGFTRTMIDLGEATNMSSDQAATALARLANITQMPQSEFDRLGSTIVALGNSLATTEAEIVDMSLRLAGAGKQVGMTEAEILALSGALSSVGIAAEAGGSAFSKVIVNMQLASEKGGKSLDDFARVAGMSSGQFQKAFQEDASGALIAFITGLQRTEDQGISAIKVLDDMGITEVRMRDALLRAAGAGDLFTESIALGTQAWEENTALTNEAAQRYETTASKIEIMRNKLQEVAITFGEILLPPLLAIVEKVGAFADWLSNLNPAIQRTIVVVGGLVAAIGPALIIIGKMASGAGVLMQTFGTLAAFITKTLIPAIAGISLPAVATVAGIAALAVVAYEVYRAWDEVKAALSATWEYLKAQAENLGISISIAMEKMKAATIGAVDSILDKLSVLEKLPFGVGEKFAGLRDSVSDSVDASAKKIAELEAAARKNSERIADATDGMKVAFGDLGGKIAEDIQLVVNKITGQTEVYAAELGEQTEIVEDEWGSQTQVILDEIEAQLRAVTEGEVQKTQVVSDESAERTEIISDESEKQKDAREKFEGDWNSKLFNLQADRREKLEAEYEAALALAEELEADKTAVIEYYAIKRKEILDAEAEEEKKHQEKLLELEEKRLETLGKFEEEWSQKLWQYTANEVERLEYERDQALALAEELGASKTAILEYYAIKHQELIDTENEKRLAEEKDHLDEITKSEEARLAEVTRIEEAWTQKVFEQSADRLEILARERDKTVAEAEAKGADITNILAYYAKEEEKILNERAVKLEAERQAEIQKEKDAAEEKERIRLDYEEAWSKKLYEQTADRVDMLRRQMLEEIKIAEQKGADTAKIVEYYSNEIKKIEQQRADEAEKARKAEAKATEDAEKKKGETRAAFEESWNKKLLQISGDRLKILEAEKKEAIKKAQELGADVTAIRKYYETLITQEQERQAKERTKRAEEEARKHQNIWQKMGLTVEKVSKDIANNVVNMFDSNYKAEEQYKSKRAKIQDDIARQIEELDKKRLEELALVAGNAEEMEKVERKYAKEKDKLHKEQQKQLRDSEDAYKENRLTIKDVLKDMVLDIISALEKQIIAQEIAAVAAAWAMSITTLGASLAKLAAALPKIAIQIGALEALKAGIRGLATGGVVKGGADQVFRLGDGREDEAVLPLNASVFNRLAEGITQQMSTTNNRTITQNITIQSPAPLSPAEIARKNKQQLRNLALEWGM